MSGGIYRIYSIATGESYYGSTKHFKRRFIEHKYLWKHNKGNKKVRLLYSKYGLDNFVFEILEYCNQDEFERREKFYIEKDPNRLNVWVLPFSPKGSKSDFYHNMLGKSRPNCSHKPMFNGTSYEVF